MSEVGSLNLKNQVTPEQSNFNPENPERFNWQNGNMAIWQVDCQLPTEN